MRYRRVGRSGLRVSEIGLGSWLTLGSALDAERGDRLVRRAFDLGINLFDTADVYAEGAAEAALGRALAALPRHELVIATKAFFPTSAGPNGRGLSRKHLFHSIETSLRRLRTDYIDLHQCHRWDPEVPLDETVRAYEDLIRQGKILYWGSSGWSDPQLGEALRCADSCGAFRPISEQPPYSLLRRDIEADVVPRCAGAGVGLLVWGALAQGVLSGKYRHGRRPPESRGADAFRARFVEAYLHPATLDRVEGLRRAAAELGVSASRLALAWCLRRGTVASAIVGATRCEQLEDNVGASGLRIPETIERTLDAHFPPPTARDPAAPQPTPRGADPHPGGETC